MLFFGVFFFVFVVVVVVVVAFLNIQLVQNLIIILECYHKIKHKLINLICLYICYPFVSTSENILYAITAVIAILTN